MEYYYASFSTMTISLSTVSRVTEAFVVFPNGRREVIDSQWGAWRPTWQEAKDALVGHCDRECADAQRRLDAAHMKLAKAIAVQP